jgi:HEAT repeat protein
MRPSAAVLLLTVSSLPFTGFCQAQASSAQSPSQQAWELLKSGAGSKSADTRRAAVGALGIVANDRRAVKLAEEALKDEKPEVRAAAAAALGQMPSSASTPKLIEAMNDKETSVALAAAQSLVRMKNAKGYDVYYQVLTGERKSGKGAVSTELDTLKDPKKLAQMGFEEGIGFVPFGGMGLEAFRVLHGGSDAAVRAAAAKILAADPEPTAATALSDAAADSSWHVRVAAVNAIAERGDPRLLSAVMAAMKDDKDEVRYSAAAAVLKLTRAPHNWRFGFHRHNSTTVP